MQYINKSDKLCLRDKNTNKLIAVYPYSVEGSFHDVEDKVRFWFYQQSCSAENELESYYVDTMTENELKNKGPLS